MNPVSLSRSWEEIIVVLTSQDELAPKQGYLHESEFINLLKTGMTLEFLCLRHALCKIFLMNFSLFFIGCISRIAELEGVDN
jgi:hypothetical protein